MRVDLPHISSNSFGAFQFTVFPWDSLTLRLKPCPDACRIRSYRTNHQSHHALIPCAVHVSSVKLKVVDGLPGSCQNSR